MKNLLSAAAATCLVLLPAQASAKQPLADAHIHYSHDAWDMLPPEEAIKVLRRAGLKKAFVSSSSDRGTQMLYKLAPDLVVPVLRPYRRRGEIGTWFRDDSVGQMVADLLAQNKYAGIGEFHLFGADADLPVPRRIIQLAKKYKIFLHAHSDAGAVDRIFAQNPDARVLWAHSGFDGPDVVGAMLAKHKNLWADLAFRSEHASGGKVGPGWRELFLEFPDRFMIGTDTFAPERWYYVIDHADWSRQWLSDLPSDLAANIAYRNAETLANWALGTEDCGEGVALAKDGYRLAYRFEPAAIKVGEPFAVRVQVCGKDDGTYDGGLKVDARMPMHKHGMNYKPQVSKTGPGQFLAQGMLLHMRGKWRFDFEISGKDGMVRLSDDHQQE